MSEKEIEHFTKDFNGSLTNDDTYGILQIGKLMTLGLLLHTAPGSKNKPTQPG